MSIPDGVLKKNKSPNSLEHIESQTFFLIIVGIFEHLAFRFLRLTLPIKYLNILLRNQKIFFW